jgi:hypothetical protein
MRIGTVAGLSCWTLILVAALHSIPLYGSACVSLPDVRLICTSFETAPRESHKRGSLLKKPEGWPREPLSNRRWRRKDQLRYSGGQMTALVNRCRPFFNRLEGL